MKVTTETVCGEEKSWEWKKKKSDGRWEHFWRKRKAYVLNHKAKLNLEAGEEFNSFLKIFFSPPPSRLWAPLSLLFKCSANFLGVYSGQNLKLTTHFQYAECFDRWTSVTQYVFTAWCRIKEAQKHLLSSPCPLKKERNWLTCKTKAKIYRQS